MSQSETFLLIGLINDLLNWREFAHEVLRDYLEERGFEQKFYQHGGLYSRMGVVRALVSIGAIEPSLISELDLPVGEQILVLKSFAQDDNTVE